MAWITLSEAKTHLNIESGYTTDDTYITHLISVAELAVSNYTNYGLTGYTGTTGTTVIPVTIKQATLLLLSNLYVNRQPIAFATPQEIPYTVKFLLDQYKNFIAN